MTIMPPPQYDFPPSVPVVEYIYPQRGEVDYRCRQAIVDSDHARTYEGSPWWRHIPSSFVFDGCTFKGEKGCVIIRIDDVDMARHERAHCNGWPWDHPK